MLTASAQKSADRQRIERQQNQLQNEIDNTNRLLADMEQTTHTLQNRIKLNKSKVEARKKLVNLLRRDTLQINIDQMAIERRIGILEKELKEKQAHYAKAVDGIIKKRRKGNKLLFILSVRSLAQSFKRIVYLRDYSKARSKEAIEIKEKRLELNQKKEELLKSKQEKTTAIFACIAEEKRLSIEEERLKKTLEEAHLKQDDLKKILLEKQQQADALRSRIAEIIETDVASSETAEKENVAESKSSTVAVSGSFAANKGKLIAPVSGAYKIINSYGAYEDEDTKVKLTNYGIDFTTQKGASAQAVFPGTVTSAFFLEGFSNCVIITHGTYRTFYGNLQNLKVKKGDKIEAGQILGSIFHDPATGISSLHFELWNNQHSMDPRPWLKK